MSNRPSQMGGISSLPSPRPLSDRADRVEMYSKVALALTRNHAKTLHVLTGESRGDRTTQKALHNLQKHLISAQVKERMTHTGLIALEAKPRERGDIIDVAGVKELGATGLNNFKRRHTQELTSLIGVSPGKWTSKQTSLIRLWLVYRLTREYGIIDSKMATSSQLHPEIITIMTQLRVLPLLLQEGEKLQMEQDIRKLRVTSSEPVRISPPKDTLPSWWRRVIGIVGSFRR